jgi:pimeloyl-ACP methyl ester carboxylesterase
MVTAPAYADRPQGFRKVQAGWSTHDRTRRSHDDQEVETMMVDQVEGTTVSRDGTTIGYRRSGTGRPLVLVHGTTADHSRWQPIVPLLEPQVSVYAVDRRGRGASGDAEAYSIEREVEDVAAVVDAVADESGMSVDVFGHSYGALCSLEAARLTERVRRLVLYEAPVLYDAPSEAVLAQLEDLLADGRRDEVVATFFREVVGMADDDVEALRALPAWTARIAAAHTLTREERSAARPFDPARYADVAIPTLLLDGEVSPPYLRRSTEALAAALPDVRVAVLEGQHHVAIDTAPEAVVAAVLGFLAEP